MKTIILALVLFALAGTAAAGSSTFGIAWNPAVTTGNTSDFVSGFQWRGAVAEMRYFTRGDLTIGGSVGYNLFYNSDEGTATDNNVTVTGKKWDYVNAIPIHLNAYKYFSQDRRSARLFAGLGAGTDWIEQRTEIGSYAIEESNWHFALAPEIGVQMPWNTFLGYVSLRWQYAFEAGDVPAQSWFDLKVGFGLE